MGDGVQGGRGPPVGLVIDALLVRRAWCILRVGSFREEIVGECALRRVVHGSSGASRVACVSPCRQDE